ncbi:ABC transporter ATP-binding protein [Paenibacillus crassostreae]|uniref:ABC transporter n=1 Tax=Paenibacillus crassostreae TaxID=1763538 RepID=A0A167FCZ8_9BACL|nr:ATP-binding cassette domain-containing protein [Paenibacillus crassostreae]AOZ90809.1 ABC transporter [Paenibacillus crassostreae]OAB76425.1 ABC transporter [Paenibacillus crassostreae]
MTCAIEFDHLTKLYNNARGIDDLNLTVQQGEIFGFLGPNGAGKTTVMKMMTGLIKPDRGDVRLFGSSVQNQYIDAIQHVGSLIETAESFPYLTAFENLKLHGRYYEQVDNKRIHECLEITGLSKFAHEKTRKFSLGMKQRLGIATAILSEPKLLILDEPLNGLDVEGMLDIRALIKKMSSEQGTTFFISSHLIHDVEVTCTRIGILLNSRLTSVDSTETILQNFSSLEHYFINEVERNARI